MDPAISSSIPEEPKATIKIEPPDGEDLSVCETGLYVGIMDDLPPVNILLENIKTDEDTDAKDEKVVEISNVADKKDFINDYNRSIFEKGALIIDERVDTRSTSKGRDQEISDPDSSTSQPTESMTRPTTAEAELTNTNEAESSCSSAKIESTSNTAEGEAENEIKDSMSQGKVVIVTGLSSLTRASDIRTIFRKHGKIAGVKIILNTRYSSSGRRRFAQVEMVSAEDATKTVNLLHNTELHGRFIQVEKAQENRNDASSQDEKSKSTGTKRSHSSKSSSISIKERSRSKEAKAGTDKECKSLDTESQGVNVGSDDELEAKQSSEGLELATVSTRPRHISSRKSSVHSFHKRGADERLERDKSYSKYHRHKDNRMDSTRVVRRTQKSMEYKERTAGSGYSSRSYTSGYSRSHFRSQRGTFQKSRYPRGSRLPSRTDLTFEKIRAAREEERRRDYERKLRDRERERRDDFSRQRALERRNAIEFEALEREREKIRIEREKVERDKEELIRLERERQRIERERIDQEREELRRAQLKIEQQRLGGLKRSFPEGKERDVGRSRNFPDHNNKKQHISGNRFPIAGFHDDYPSVRASGPDLRSNLQRSQDEARFVRERAFDQNDVERNHELGRGRSNESHGRSSGSFTPVRDAPMRDVPERDRVSTNSTWERPNRDKAAAPRAKIAPAAPKIGNITDRREHAGSMPARNAPSFAFSFGEGTPGSSGTPVVKERSTRYDANKSGADYLSGEGGFMKRQSSINGPPSAASGSAQNSNSANPRNSWGSNRKSNSWVPPNGGAHRSEFPDRWVSGSGSTLVGGVGSNRTMPVAPPPPQGIYNNQRNSEVSGGNVYHNDRYDSCKQNARRY